MKTEAGVSTAPPPYHWLQGLVALGALLTATVVLGKQNRLARLEEQRAHLELKATLLTEQKAAKLIDLLEELRIGSSAETDDQLIEKIIEENRDVLARLAK